MRRKRVVESSKVADALEKLAPGSKFKSEIRAMIEANLAAIYTAKDRGCTWAAIAVTLTEVGIVITPTALRFMMSAIPRDLKKYPHRSLVGQRQKREGRQSSISKGKMQGNADEERDEDRSAVKSEESTNAPASIPPRIPPRIDPNSFAGIRRRNMKI